MLLPLLRPSPFIHAFAVASLRNPRLLNTASARALTSMRAAFVVSSHAEEVQTKSGRKGNLTLAFLTVIASKRSNSGSTVGLLHTAHPYTTTAATQSRSPSSTPSKVNQLEKPSALDPAESHVWDLLAAALAPTQLSVSDISGGCGSMYLIDVASAQFRGKSMVAQQRMVLAALKGVREDWHGVQIRTQVPEDDVA